MVQTIKRTAAYLAAFVLAFSLAGCVGDPAPVSDVSEPTGGTQTTATQATEDTGASQSASGSQDDGQTTGTSQAGGKTTTTATKGSGKTTTTKKESTPTASKKPITLRFGTVWEAWYNGQAGSNPYVDAYKAKVAEIKKKYNVNIQFQSITAETTDIITRAIMAGDEPYSMMELPLDMARPMAMNGALYDQGSISTLDLSQKRFAMNKNMCENVSFNGKTYASNFGFQMLSLMGVYANVDLLKKYDQPDVNKLYKDKTWTFKAFRDICSAVKRDTDGDGKLDIYGVVSTGSIAGIALTSNAGGTVIRDGNGNYVGAMTSNVGIETYQWIRDLYITDKSYYKTNLDSCLSMFKAGKAAFYTAGLDEYGMFAEDCDFELTIVPFPIGPSQKTYKSGMYGGRYWVMPKTVSDPELVGSIFSELSKVDMDGIGKKLLKDAGVNNAGVEAAYDIQNYISPEFVNGVDTTAIGNVGENALYSQNGNPATALSSNASQFQKAIDDYYSRVKK